MALLRGESGLWGLCGVPSGSCRPGEAPCHLGGLLKRVWGSVSPAGPAALPEGAARGCSKGWVPQPLGGLWGWQKKRENGIFEPLSVCGGGGGVVGVGCSVGLAWVCFGFFSFSPCCLVRPVSAWINAWK